MSKKRLKPYFKLVEKYSNQISDKDLENMKGKLLIRKLYNKINKIR